MDTAYGVKRGKKGKGKYPNGSVVISLEPLKNIND